MQFQAAISIARSGELCRYSTPFLRLVAYLTGTAEGNLIKGGLEIIFNKVWRDRGTLCSVQSIPFAGFPLGRWKSREDSSTRKRGRNEGDIDAELEASVEAAVIAVGRDWLENVMIATDTTGTTPDAATDSTSGTQTPASSADSEIILRIDPRLLLDEPGKGGKG
ncbi:hypothetical protein K469DRAFT_684784 [Zopfia rhizophila CBS 207.26]|uniref:Uncharacterized protein n=1 Tax=Zopfia rhizophila CBS 207.26 TaxID=1314779 RepID=A0A6A6D9S1_9PEZI|nr:hypothetical protein K469DRAFT_684784 [Zopfia rhizophila CBS 207.26]